MELKQEQLQELLSLKNAVDDDNIRYKEIIKKTLIEDELIIYLLNDKELEDADADPSEYLGRNILPLYLIHPTQSNSKNFICYETDVRELNEYNPNMKTQIITFYVLCEQKNVIEPKTGIARHDLIGAQILKLFNWTNLFGAKIHCVSNVAGVTDTDYATRTIVFEQETDNNLAKTYNGVSRMNFRNFGAISNAKEP